VVSAKSMVVAFAVVEINDIAIAEITVEEKMLCLAEA